MIQSAIFSNMLDGLSGCLVGSPVEGADIQQKGKKE